MSVRASAISPRACSGDRYDARPNTTPGAVFSCLSTLRARPKSVSFTSPK